MKETKTIRIGLLGFGSMGKAHSYAVNNLPFYYNNLPFSAQIGGVCTTTAKSADLACQTLGISFSTLDEDQLIFSPDIDVIDICTPNRFHYETLKKALLAGKHVYCEKPLCIASEQADEIARLAKARPELICNVVFNNRFLAPILRAKELVDEGRIGRLISFSARYLHSSALDPNIPIGWKQDRSVCGGGVLYDLGSHLFDLVYFLCGKFDSVCATTQIAYDERNFRTGGWQKASADDAFYLLAKLQNGAVGTISASKVAAGANDDLSIELFGEKGSLRFSLMDTNYLYFYDNQSPDTALGGNKGFTAIECVGRYPAPGGQFPSPKASSGWLRGHVESMYRFLNSIHTGKQEAPSFSDAAYVQHVMSAAYRSCESETWVTVEDCL